MNKIWAEFSDEVLAVLKGVPRSLGFLVGCGIVICMIIVGLSMIDFVVQSFINFN